jgi:hypothetical protein
MFGRLDIYAESSPESFGVNVSMFSQYLEVTYEVVCWCHNTATDASVLLYYHPGENFALLVIEHMYLHYCTPSYL